MDDDARLALLDALIYADGFDCALTTTEIARGARLPIDAAQIERLLTEDGPLRDVTSARGGFVTLRGRESLIDERPARIERAQALQVRARRAARVAARAPFVRGLALTGSLAASDARPGADADLLVIVEPGRLASVFLILGSLSRLYGRRVCP
ncbi:MAG: hypothetical protein F2796_05725, partial [Actinobacteria bacterium]|nr:hypothetical protein [Actinomycetota bacterium]